MELLNIKEFQLIKKDFSVLRQDLFEENGINDWDKLIIIYNFCMLINYVYYTYSLLGVLYKDNSHFREQFLNVYLFFYCITSLNDCYLYFIKNVYRINPKLALQMHENLKEYFLI